MTHPIKSKNTTTGPSRQIAIMSFISRLYYTFFHLIVAQILTMVTHASGFSNSSVAVNRASALWGKHY